MKQMTLKLDSLQQRPVVIVGNGMTALLDTGAYIPVWTDDESILVEKLGAEMVAEGVSFTGFGGRATGNLYKVTLQLGDLIYPNMIIISNDDLEVPFNMILSATMFQNLIYEIDDRNHRLNITIPDEESKVRNLRIVNSDGMIHVLCSSNEEM